MESTATIISTIISTFISSLIAVILYLKKDKMDKERDNRDKERDIKQQLDNILNIAIKYPFLEDNGFIKDWNNKKNSGDERYLQYDIYCTMLFNYLERMWEIYNGNVKEIEDFMDVKSWVRTHRDYWKNPANSYENIEGYKIEFRNFINQYLD